MPDDIDPQDVSDNDLEEAHMHEVKDGDEVEPIGLGASAEDGEGEGEDEDEEGGIEEGEDEDEE